MKTKQSELENWLSNFQESVVKTTEMYAVRGGLSGTATNDEETGCYSDNRCDDCKNDSPPPNQ